VFELTEFELGEWGYPAGNLALGCNASLLLPGAAATLGIAADKPSLLLLGRVMIPSQNEAFNISPEGKDASPTGAATGPGTFN
jgi:hypothetical protein